MTTPVIPREVLFGNPERGSPALSPNGDLLAWIAPHEDVLNVWVSDIGVPGTERAITADRGRGVRLYAWAPDSRHILFLQDTDGDEDWRLRIVELETGEVRDLTPSGCQARIEKISHRHPEEILVSLNQDRPQLHDMYRLDLTSGELVKVFENPGFAQMLADEQFVVRAGVEPTADGGMHILVRDDETAPWRMLLDVPQQDAMGPRLLAFHADGSRLLATTSVGANAAQLVWFDVATGEREIVASDPTHDVGGAFLHNQTNEPRIVHFLKERLSTQVLDPTITDEVAALMTQHDGDAMILGSDDLDLVWLVAVTHDDGPIRYHAWVRADAKSVFLFSHQPLLEQYRLASMEPFRIGARDGLELPGYITFPPDTPRDNLPTVVLVHGGPWTRDTWGFNAPAQWLANRGYAAIQVNFRGSSGYGKRHINAGDRQWGAAMHTDLLDAVDWAVRQGWVDPARVGIMGGSYGGYAALIGATHTPEKFACAIAMAAPTNLKTLIESLPIYWDTRRSRIHSRIGDPETDAELLWSRSPLSRIDQIRKPLMIVQGANDPRVPITETRQILAALEHNKIPHEYLLFDNEGHGLARPENRLAYFAAAERFLAEHLGGRRETVVQRSPQLSMPQAIRDRSL